MKQIIILILILLTGCGKTDKPNTTMAPNNPYVAPQEPIDVNPIPLLKNCNEGFKTDFKPYNYNGNLINGYARINEKLTNNVCYVTITVNNIKGCGETVIGIVQVNYLAGSSRFLTVILDGNSCLFTQEFNLVYSFGHYYYDVLEIDFNGE